jgi:hypothetical protein
VRVLLYHIYIYNEYIFHHHDIYTYIYVLYFAGSPRWKGSKSPKSPNGSPGRKKSPKSLQGLARKKSAIPKK